MLDKYPHSSAKEQKTQDEAVDILVERADMGALGIDMSNLLGYTSKFTVVPKR